MRSSICNKDLYKAYLVASSIRYSGVALSEVSPTKLSHDAVSRWLSSRSYTPSMVWDEAKNLIDKAQNCTRDKVENIMKMRWNIEVYHRELKQTCGIERCMSRTGRAQRNHICMAILAWIYRFKKRLISSYSFYQQQWLNIRDSITANMKIILT